MDAYKIYIKKRPGIQKSWGFFYIKGLMYDDPNVSMLICNENIQPLTR